MKSVTKTEQLIGVIRRLGRARTGDLAKATGVPSASISVLLAVAVRKGILTVCKVTVPGLPPSNEYRIGGGMAVPDFQPLKTKRIGVALGTAAHRNTEASKAPPQPPKPDSAEPPVFLNHQPQPAVGKNTGSARSGMSSTAASPEAHAVAAPATPKPASERRGTGPAQTKASAGDATSALDIRIDHDGTITIGTVESVIELDPQQARKLGHFMAATHGIWNPF